MCSVASKLLSQENDAIAKATEEVLRAYREFDIEKISGKEKDTTASSTQLFDKNIATDSSLSTADKAVYAVLRILADNEALECSPKVRTIAIKASCSQRAVYRSLNNLEAIGAIKRTPRYRNHRQISSLYKILGYKPACNSDTSNVSNTDYHSNTIADKGCPVNEPIDCQDITETNLQTVVGIPNCQSNNTTERQTENTFRIFKDSIRGVISPLQRKKIQMNPMKQFLKPIQKNQKTPLRGSPSPHYSRNSKRINANVRGKTKKIL